MHVPGSPFRLKIGKQDADPAAVHAHGKGLEKGHTGHKSDFIIDTCSAGAGTLGVTIDGPSKVRLDHQSVDISLIQKHMHIFMNYVYPSGDFRHV